MQALPQSWLTILGIQFENILLNNLESVIAILNIPPQEVVTAGPYLQTETKSRKKCQIDLLIQTRYNQLYVCEIKFSKGSVEKK